MAVGWALLDMNAEMQREVQGISFEAEKENIEGKPKTIVNPCPKCGDELQFQGGCNICKTCGWTKCD
jgi:ribonucleoside-diphosphate reductase alpha chain